MLHNFSTWWHFRPKKELTLVYISIALRFFALSLFGIFLPLYFYQEIGFSLAETLYFYLIFSMMFAIFTPVGGKLCSKLGIKHTVLLSIPLYVAFLVFILLLPILHTPLFVLGLLCGGSLGIYWIGMHLVFHHASHYGYRGEEFGKRDCFKILASTAGPLLGGYLIASFGFMIVFVLASILLITSGIILLLSEESLVEYHFSFKSIVNKDHWKNSLFFVSRGTEIVSSGILWPLFVFFLLKGYFSLGVVGALLSGVSAVLVLLIGKYSDKKGKRIIIRWVTPFESLSWIFRSLVTTSTGVFGATIFGAVTHGLREAPIGAMEYDKAKDDVAGYFVSREIFICLGRIFMLVFVLMANNLSDGLLLQAGMNLLSFIF